MTIHYETRPPSSPYPGERAGERGERRETSVHRPNGKTAPVFESSASPTSGALSPSPLPSPRRTGEREVDLRLLTHALRITASALRR